MLNSEQTTNIGEVFKHFERLDNDGLWTAIDDSICSLEWLSDRELLNEAYLVSEKHRWGNPRCTVDHSKDSCMIPLVVKAVDSLLEHYVDDKDTATITPAHKTIFQWYLALDHTGEIIY